ncbi:hypothetical protein [Zavarzinia aquatilis]|uniref:hypothetical protein n=1 Tax=Zavarzinia aquatilis TaxID=2211142 RepID=UPI001401F1F8|nr:hypothetical protein [Zavarzinia aquatilis]
MKISTIYIKCRMIKALRKINGKCIYAIAIILVFFPSRFSKAQDDDMCDIVKNLVFQLQTDPSALHGEDAKRDNEFIVSMPRVVLPNAEECEISTSDDRGGLYYSYECAWPQNKGTDEADARKFGYELAKYISECYEVKINNQEKSERVRWWGNIRSNGQSTRFEVIVPLGLRYNRISLRFGGISE